MNILSTFNRMWKDKTPKTYHKSSPYDFCTIFHVFSSYTISLGGTDQNISNYLQKNPPLHHIWKWIEQDLLSMGSVWWQVTWCRKQCYSHNIYPIIPLCAVHMTELPSGEEKSNSVQLNTACHIQCTTSRFIGVWNKPQTCLLSISLCNRTVRAEICCKCSFLAVFSYLLGQSAQGHAGIGFGGLCCSIKIS